MTTLPSAPAPTFGAADDLMLTTYQPEVIVELWNNGRLMCGIPYVNGTIEGDVRSLPQQTLTLEVSHSAIELLRALDPQGLGQTLPQVRHWPYGLTVLVRGGPKGATRPIFWGEITQAVEVWPEGTWNITAQDPTVWLTNNFAGGLRTIPRAIPDGSRRADLALQWLWGAAGVRGLAQRQHTDNTLKADWALIGNQTYRTLPTGYTVGGSGETAAAAAHDIMQKYDVAIATSPTTDGTTFAEHPPVYAIPQNHLHTQLPTLTLDWKRNVTGWDRDYGRAPNQLLTAVVHKEKTTAHVAEITSGYNAAWFVGTWSKHRQIKADDPGVTPGAVVLANAALRARAIRVDALPHFGVWLRRRASLALDDPRTAMPCVIVGYRLPLDGSAMSVDLLPETEDWGVEDE